MPKRAFELRAAFSPSQRKSEYGPKGHYGNPKGQYGNPKGQYGNPKGPWRKVSPTPSPNMKYGLNRVAMAQFGLRINMVKAIWPRMPDKALTGPQTHPKN